MESIIIRNLKHFLSKQVAIIRKHRSVIISAIPIVLIYSVTQILYMSYLYDAPRNPLVFLAIVPIAVFGLILLWSFLFNLTDIWGKAFEFICLLMLLLSLLLFVLTTATFPPVTRFGSF